MTHWQHYILETTWRHSFPQSFLRACVHACQSAQRAINNIYRSLGVHLQRESVYVTSTLNIFLRYMGTGIWVANILHYIPLRWNPREHGCSRCTRSPMLGVNEHMGLKLFGREIIFQEFKPIWTRYLIVTDGRTDRRTDESNLITALCASIAQ